MATAGGTSQLARGVPPLPRLRQEFEIRSLLPQLPCESYFQGYTFFLHHSGCVRCQQMYGPDAVAYFDLATDVFSE